MQLIHYAQYLKKVLMHKWFVFQAGLKVGKIPLYRLLWHDLSKLSRAEFAPYAAYILGERTDDVKHAFDLAWNHHQKNNRHHWQYWLLLEAGAGQVKPLPMPETFVREMVADWMGAGRAYTQSWDMTQWLQKNLPRLILHPQTAAILYRVLTEQGYDKVLEELIHEVDDGE